MIATGRILRATVRLAAIVVPVFLITTLITFVLGASSGLNPAASLAGDAATPERVAQVSAELGLDRPLIVRYATWLAHVFRGDFGDSWYNRLPVGGLIVQRLGVTVSMVLFAMILAVVVGGLLGVIAGLRSGGAVDRAVTAVTTITSALPPFVVSIALIVVLSVWLRLLPSSGYVPFSQDPVRWALCMIMPALALSFEPAADIARQLRTGLVHVMRQNYIVGARVRGLPASRILVVHALRNACGPVIAVLGVKIPGLLGGAVVTETIFSMPGLGVLTADAALRGDVPVVQGALVVAVVIVLAAGVAANGLIAWMQPASRRQGVLS